MRRRPLNGFTCPELLVVTAIVGILAGVAMPMLGEAMARHRLRIAGAALLASLDRARAAAVLRQREVEVCPSPDGRACPPQADWSGGWIVRDSHANGTTLEASGRLDDRLAAFRGQRREVIFARAGTSHRFNQRITLCLRGKPFTAFTVVISPAGRSRREPSHADEATACAGSHARHSRGA